MSWIIFGLSLFVLWTLFNALAMRPLPNRTHSQAPCVHILIPLRNEAREIAALIRSLQEIHYTNCHFYILDDRSEDDTWTLLKTHTAGDSRFTLLQGAELPACWKGKPYACMQLADVAREGADYYLFLDSDVRLAPSFVGCVVTEMERSHASLVTGFLRYETNNWTSRLLVPLQHWLVGSFLPILLANSPYMSVATAAQGGMMCFRTSAYWAVGTHRAVKDALVDDVAFAQLMKRRGHRVRLCNITNGAHCEMYPTNTEAWQGFQKNAFALVGHSYIGAIGFVCMLLLYVNLPLLGLFFGGPFVASLFALLIYAQRAVIDVLFRTSGWATLAHPFALLFFSVLLLKSAWNTWRKKPVVWKGRKYS
ncbi:MAG: glycosyltransferase [Bacilli bacterium]